MTTNFSSVLSDMSRIANYGCDLIDYLVSCIDGTKFLENICKRNQGKLPADCINGLVLLEMEKEVEIVIDWILLWVTCRRIFLKTLRFLIPLEKQSF